MHDHHLQRHPDHRDLHSFPTRRSSDLPAVVGVDEAEVPQLAALVRVGDAGGREAEQGLREGVEQAEVGDALPKRADRKSTRLNSSHGYISYAVFCVKNKTLKAMQTATI